MVAQAPSLTQQEVLVPSGQSQQVMEALDLLIDVVGKESVLGIVLVQARCEINSLAPDADR